MSNNVNPPLFSAIPNNTDPQLRLFLRQQQEVIRQLYNKTGGQVDPIDGALTSIEEVDAALSAQKTKQDDENTATNARIDTTNSDVDTLDTSLDAEILRIDSLVNQVSAINNVIERVVGYTTTGTQVIICVNPLAISVTLNASPATGERVTVKRTDAEVDIIATIDGVANKTLAANESATIIYSGTAWYTI